ncbi:hypothetical protein GALL_379290 [mine drainage metagenome]|uniref:Uncharacterized protein n=1 Tax=mine drainage metagenome TaxID=410659 RepID=A0A1J5QS61_9ZZZZ
MRQHFGQHRIDSKLCRHRASRGPLVAGKQHHFQSQLAQAGNGRPGIRLDGIGNRDQTRQLAIGGEINRRRSLGGKTVGMGLQRGAIDAVLLQQLPGPQQQVVAVHHAQDALSRKRTETFDLHGGKIAAFCRSHDGFCQRML